MEPDGEQLTKQQRREAIARLEKEMKEAAKMLEFEIAAAFAGSDHQIAGERNLTAYPELIRGQDNGRAGERSEGGWEMKYVKGGWTGLNGTALPVWVPCAGLLLPPEPYYVETHGTMYQKYPQAALANVCTGGMSAGEGRLSQVCTAPGTMIYP